MDSPRLRSSFVPALQRYLTNASQHLCGSFISSFPSLTTSGRLVSRSQTAILFQLRLHKRRSGDLRPLFWYSDPPEVRTVGMRSCHIRAVLISWHLCLWSNQRGDCTCCTGARVLMHSGKFYNNLLLLWFQHRKLEFWTCCINGSCNLF